MFTLLVNVSQNLCMKDVLLDLDAGNKYSGLIAHQGQNGSFILV